jgi:hypothetical protein
MLVIAQLGCFAPRTPGPARTTYITMATMDGAMAGGLGGFTLCHLFTEGMAHGTTPGNRVPSICGVVGMVGGGGAALYGSLVTDAEPDRGTWIAIGTLSALALAMGIGLVVKTVKD